MSSYRLLGLLDRTGVPPIPAETRRETNVILMLARRLRRWSNINKHWFNVSCPLSKCRGFNSLYGITWQEVVPPPWWGVVAPSSRCREHVAKPIAGSPPRIVRHTGVVRSIHVCAQSAIHGLSAASMSVRSPPYRGCPEHPGLRTRQPSDPRNTQEHLRPRSACLILKSFDVDYNNIHPSVPSL